MVLVMPLEKVSALFSLLLLVSVHIIRMPGCGWPNHKSYVRMLMILLGLLLVFKKVRRGTKTHTVE